jgi:hypothetical protein
LQVLQVPYLQELIFCFYQSSLRDGRGGLRQFPGTEVPGLVNRLKGVP